MADPAKPHAGRADYDRLIRFTQLEPGEPYFFIRGRDQVGGAAVRAWAALAYKAGAPAAIVESALQQADLLDAWPTKRLPDADHLEGHERRALEYQLSRRAWSHRTAATPNETILLAEARGATAAVARNRHADALLAGLVEALAPVAAKSTAGAEAMTRLQGVLTRVVQDLAMRTGVEIAPPAADPAEAAPAIVPFIIPAPRAAPKSGETA